MGVIQTIKDGLNKVDQTVNPLRQVGDVLEAAVAPGQKGLPEAIERSRVYPRLLGIDKTAPNTAPAEVKTSQQAAYEAKEKAMNANNPFYQGPSGTPVPRAKGGPVKAGGHPMKNVDNSGLKKEPC